MPAAISSRMAWAALPDDLSVQPPFRRSIDQQAEGTAMRTVIRSLNRLGQLKVLRVIWEIAANIRGLPP